MTFAASWLELGAAIVDLLDVALGPRRPDDVGRVGDPALQPVEALLAHALGQDRHAAAAHDPADRHAAAAVVAGRRPDRALLDRVELARDDPRREAGVGGEHLVGGDHREAVAERDHDRAVDAGQRRAAARGAAGRGARDRRSRVVEPVDAEEVERIGASGSTLARRPSMASGIVAGSASWAKVGMTMLASRKRSTARS